MLEWDDVDAEVCPAVYHRKQGEMRVGDGAISIRMWLSFFQAKLVQVRFQTGGQAAERSLRSRQFYDCTPRGYSHLG